MSAPSNTCWSAWTIGLICWLANSVAVAEPYVEHMSPPSVARGQRNRLVLVGESVDRPVGIWTSLPDGKFKVLSSLTTSPRQAEFEVEVSPECPLGLYGVRLATEDGLSNLQLFLVDDLIPDSKPAFSRKEFPFAVAGVFRSAEVDRYEIQVDAGQRLSFDVVSSRLGTDADPLITIFNSSGQRVVQRDNDPGLFFDCCFEHTFELAGNYTVEVRDARFQGAPHWRYLLRVGNFPAVRVAVPSAVRPGEATSLRFPELADAKATFEAPKDLPLGAFFYSLKRPIDAASNWVPLLSTDLRSVVEAEPNDLPDQATEVGSAPVYLHGTLGKAGDRDQFLLEFKQGEKIALRAETKALNSAADVELAVFDSAGREIQRNDDLTLPGGVLEEATLTLNVGKAGKYRLQVREITNQGGPQFTYRVEVRAVTPRFQLTSPVSAFTIPQQCYQRLPITVVRTDYAGPIALSLENSPANVKLEPDLIPAGATSVDCKLLAGENSPLGVYTFSIAGRAEIGDKTVDVRTMVQPMVDRQLSNVDLIKYALRDNQRWLPPSVTNVMALQITPPVPFAVELVETTVTLPRYQQTEVLIQTNRVGGFDSPISFSATGGQLGEESQGRRQVFGRFPVGLGSMPIVSATIHSRSQAQELKERIDLTAVAKHGERTITLVRSFQLDVRPAFAITLEPAQVTLEPGGSTKVRVQLQRLPSFSGPVIIEPAMNAGVALPESISIEQKQTSAEFDVTVAADVKPGKRKVRFSANGQVNGFQEETKPIELELEVKLDKKP